MAAGRDEFLARLAAEFPDVIAGFGPYSAGLLHCEVGDFREATERAMDAGRLWEAERHFRLVAELLAVAGAELRNALEVSYLEDLALGEFTPGATGRSVNGCLRRCGRSSSDITHIGNESMQ